MEAGEGAVRYQAEGGQALLTIDRPRARNARVVPAAELDTAVAGLAGKLASPGVERPLSF
jgi:hypothetical protein